MGYGIRKFAGLVLLLLAIALFVGMPGAASGQSPGEPFARDPSKDVPTADINDLQSDIWSDGTTMWVLDTIVPKIYAYNLATKERDSEKDFDTLHPARNDAPAGIWSDGTTMWVADSADRKIYAYNLATKQQDAEKDFDTLEGVGNSIPSGIWSDGTTMWVATFGYQTGEIFAYNLMTKALEAGKGFNTLQAAGHHLPSDLWSDGTTMWVANPSDDKIYAYNMETKARESEKDFNIIIGFRGSWSDGTTMWFSLNNPSRIHAYNVATKQRDSQQDFSRLPGSGNNNSIDIWSDGTTMWVVDSFDHELYAYNLASKQRDSGKGFKLAVGRSNDQNYGNNSPSSIASDGTTMWVADWYDDKIYAYELATGQPDSTNEYDFDFNQLGDYIWTNGTTLWIAYEDSDQIVAFNIITKQFDPGKNFGTLNDAGNNNPHGIWSDGTTTMWVADTEDAKLYAYNMTTKQREPEKDFEGLSDFGNSAPRGIWSDGTTMWISDWEDRKIYAYNHTTKARDAEKDFNALSDAGKANPEAIWSDGTTVWIADDENYKIYAYDLATGLPDPGMDFDTLAEAGNRDPEGMWSDGTTMWVSDLSDNKIYAYNMDSKLREMSKEFNTLVAAGNYSPTGIWSDGTTMWVVDWLNFKIFAYNMDSKLREADKEFNTLAAAGNNFPTGIWSDRTTMWVADWIGDKLYAYDLATKERDASRDAETLSAAGNNHPEGLWSDGITMWVADENDDKLYAYNMSGDTSTLGGTTTTPGNSTIRPITTTEEPEPPPPSAVEAQCITGTASEDSNTGRINLGETIEDRWSGGCPSVTRGGRMAKYYTFSVPHTTAVAITLLSNLDNYLVLRKGDLSGPVVAKDDDSFILLNAKIAETLPAGDYTIEATTFGITGVEAEFLLSAVAVDRVLYSGPASEKAPTGYSPSDSTLDIRILPTLPLPTLQITIRDEDGFGPGQPGAAEMLLQGRIETDVGSPGSIMLAVPNGVWVGHGDITVQTKTSAAGSSWEDHTAEDEQKLLEEDSGGFFGFLGGLVKTISSLIGGSNPLNTIAGWLRLLNAGQDTVAGDEAAVLGLGGNPVSPIFKGNHANCFSQVSVPWLVEEEEVTSVRISIPVILTGSEYVSVGAEFIARESDENEQSLVQAHDLLSIGQSLPACQRP